jgi:hypothetical protein
MGNGAVTVLLVALLITAASLASYFWSQSRVIYYRGKAFPLAGVGAGASLLIGTVVLIVLAAILLARFNLADFDVQEMIEATVSNPQATRPNPFAPVSKSTPEPKTKSDPSKTAAGGDALGRERGNDVASSSPRPSVARNASSHVAANIDANRVVAPPIVDLWAATRCVVPIRREWDGVTRWTIVNDCGAPVGVLAASEALVLPAKYQRSVTEAEERIDTTSLHHSACLVTNPRAIRLIGMNIETRRTADWQAEFATARQEDPCLSAIPRPRGTGLTTEP